MFIPLSCATSRVQHFQEPGGGRVQPSCNNRSACSLRFASLAIMMFAGLFCSSVSPAFAERVQGSGSTFAYPIISAWTKSFLVVPAE
jgi:hypothetical protein